MRHGNANFDFSALLGEVLPVLICFLLSDQPLCVKLLDAIYEA